MKFRKKPIVIEAVQLRRDTWDEMCEFVGIGYLTELQGNLDGKTMELDIPTLEGVMRANEGDWIIRGVKGEFYPCKPDIFRETYEEVN